MKIGMKLDNIHQDNSSVLNRVEKNVIKFYKIINDAISGKELVPDHQMICYSYPEWYFYDFIQSIIKKRKLHKIHHQPNGKDFFLFQETKGNLYQIIKIRQQYLH